MARGPSIKAVNLSEVRQEKKSAEQASLTALEQSIDEDLKKKARRSNFLIGSIATVMSLYWAGAVSAFIWGLYNTGSIEPSTQWLGTVLIILILPIVFIWMVSLIAKRSQDLKAEANHLAAIALRLTHPEDQASREITRLGHAVRRQVEAMEKEMDLALTRVSQLDNTLRSQTKTLNKTTDETEARIGEIRASLESERKHLEALAGKIEAQSKALADQIESKTETLETAASAVSETLATADNTLQTRLEALQQASTETLERTRATAGELSQQIDSLGSVSKLAVDQSESAAAVYQQHLEALGKATHLLAEEGRSLESKSRDHQTALADLTKQAGDKVEAIELGLQKSTAQIESALSDAKISADQIGDDFVRKTEEKTKAIESTVSDTASLIEVSLDSLETQADQIARKVASQIEDTASAVEGTMVETTRRFELRLSDAENKISIAGQSFERATSAIEQQSREATQALSGAGETAQRVAGEARDILQKSTAGLKEDVEFSVAVFSDALEQMTGQNARLKSALDSQDELLSQMPALVAEQVNTIESLVSGSADRVKKSIESTLEDASQLDSKMEAHARSLLTNGEDVLRALNAGLERTRQEAEDARTALTARTATIVSEIEAAGTAADDVIQKTEDALLKRAESLKLLMTESDAHAQGITQAAQERLASGLIEMKGEIDQAEQAIDDAIQRLAGTTGQIQDATHGATAVLDATIGQMEERFKQFPEQAKDSGERIRSIVLTQISSLTDISEEAANRVLNLDAAFQARIRGIYDTLARLLPPADSAEGQALLAPQSSPLSATLAPPITQDKPAEDQKSEQAVHAPQKSREIYPQIWDGMDGQEITETAKSLSDSPMPESDESSLQDNGLAKRLARRLKRDRNTRLSIDSPDAPEGSQDDHPDPSIDSPDAPEGSQDDHPDPSMPGAFEVALKDALKPQPAGESKKAKKMKWREILSAAESGAGVDTPAYTPKAANISRTTDHMVETLQAMTVDLSRALDSDAPNGLVDRYLAGERDLFAKRLAKLSKGDLGKKIRKKYQSDSEFKSYVDRYILQFDKLQEELGTEGAAKATSNTETKDTRQVYELLKNAVAPQH